MHDQTRNGPAALYLITWCPCPSSAIVVSRCALMCIGCTIRSRHCGCDSYGVPTHARDAPRGNTGAQSTECGELRFSHRYRQLVGVAATKGLPRCSAPTVSRSQEGQDPRIPARISARRQTRIQDQDLTAGRSPYSRFQRRLHSVPGVPAAQHQPRMPTRTSVTHTLTRQSAPVSLRTPHTIRTAGHAIRPPAVRKCMAAQIYTRCTLSHLHSAILPSPDRLLHHTLLPPTRRHWGLQTWPASSHTGR